MRTNFLKPADGCVDTNYVDSADVVNISAARKISTIGPGGRDMVGAFSRLPAGWVKNNSLFHLKRTRFVDKTLPRLLQTATWVARLATLRHFSLLERLL